LHLGNARTFLINWALARQNGWRIVLRIEDLDGPRVKADASRQAIDILHWLGIDWDEGPYDQLGDLSPYQQALDNLIRAGLAYPCRCTRKEIADAQSAPHDEPDHDLRYPGTCRPTSGQNRPPLSDDDAAWRITVPDETITFIDAFSGTHSVNVQRQVGDFVVATKAQLPAYQLAVVVDDARQGITHVVRGDDLLPSAARQLWIYRLLNLGPPPSYLHVPLVLGPDGRRLAKRHGDSRILTYRQRGVTPQQIIGLIAYWSGVTKQLTLMDGGEFLARFSLAQLPRQPIIMTKEIEAWLHSGVQ
jgi:glutamyl-tRNA synthetase